MKKSMIDLAYDILSSEHKAMKFLDLLNSLRLKWNGENCSKIFFFPVKKPPFAPERKRAAASMGFKNRIP